MPAAASAGSVGGWRRENRVIVGCCVAKVGCGGV